MQRPDRVFNCIAISLIVLLTATYASMAQESEHQAGGENTAVIDAAQYEQLQDAIDALPDGGGMIVLPPGRYELEKSLILNTDFVTIKGAGPSTHLVNTSRPIPL